MNGADGFTRRTRGDILATARCLTRLKKIAASEWAGPCPRCGGRDRFSVNVRKQLFNCRGCGGRGDVIDLLRHVHGASFVEAVAQLGRAPAADIEHVGGSLQHNRRVQICTLVQRIVARLVPIKGTDGERYLRETRGIDTDSIADVLARTDAIGWHPAAYFNQPDHALHGRSLGCIVGVMSDPATAAPTGAISRTYVHEDRNLGKAKTLGSPAGIVRLSEDEDVLEGLHIAEGLETALSGMALGLRPMWALGSAGAVAAFPVLGGIEALTLLQEKDTASERACEACAARWHAAGREVFINQPTSGKDLNDAIRARGAS